MNKQSEFLNAFLKTNGHEGGYVNDPTDRGGETYKGIARKFWPNWEGWSIIDILKKKYKHGILNARLNANAGLQAMVEEFYRHNYWNKNMLYEFDQAIADEIYDTGVNQGAKTAAKYFQKALSKLNRNQKDFPDLLPDGKIGNKTILAYRAYMATERFSTRSYTILIGWLLSIMNYYQLDKYINIADNDLSQERFIPGWLNRV
jgi:lysozyme family protein